MRIPPIELRNPGQEYWGHCSSLECVVDCSYPNWQTWRKPRTQNYGPNGEILWSPDCRTYLSTCALSTVMFFNPCNFGSSPRQEKHSASSCVKTRSTLRFR